MISFPSNVLGIVDVPEVAQLKARFIYNFYVDDEHVSSGEGGSAATNKGTNAFKPSAKFNERAPRYVEISFTPVIASIGSLFSNIASDSKRQDDGLKIDLAKHQASIYSEDGLSNAMFSGFKLQDTGIDGKFYIIASASVSKAIAKQNEAVFSAIESKSKSISGLAIDQYSLLDKAKLLNDETGDLVTPDFVISSLNQINALAASYVDDHGVQTATHTLLNELRDVVHKVQVNNKLIDIVVRRMASDPLSPYADESAQMLADVDAKHALVSSIDSSKIASIEFDKHIMPISEPQIVSRGTMLGMNGAVVGYVIDKDEIVVGDGQATHVEHRKPIFVNDMNATVVIDDDVAYGHMYSYSVHTVMKIDMLVAMAGTDDVSVVSVLVSSAGGKHAIVECFERVPPPSSIDVKPIWDYGRAMLCITWSFPINRQRDIRRFQVFRRRSILDPFELQREIRFDGDADIAPSDTNIDPSIISVAKSPTLFYYDDEFTKHDHFIYAIASVDVHGMSSDYSIQLRVSFNQHANALIVEHISQSGAPRAYPNMLISSKLFDDTIVDSGHSSITVHFDPEYAQLRNSVGADLHALAMSNDGLYRLQVTNLDLQQSHGVDIRIDDHRTSVPV